MGLWRKRADSVVACRPSALGRVSRIRMKRMSSWRCGKRAQRGAHEAGRTSGGFVPVKLTPEERSAEMKRRAKVRERNRAAKAKVKGRKL